MQALGSGSQILDLNGHSPVESFIPSSDCLTTSTWTSFTSRGGTPDTPLRKCRAAADGEKGGESVGLVGGETQCKALSFASKREETRSGQYPSANPPSLFHCAAWSCHQGQEVMIKEEPRSSYRRLGAEEDSSGVKWLHLLRAQKSLRVGDAGLV